MDEFKAGVTALVLAGVIATLMLSSLSADAVLFTGLGVLILTGVLDGKTALAGFANEGMMTVGLLFIVAAGLRQTGAMTRLAGWLLGKPTGVRGALARMSFPVAILSAFLNNTPIVASLMPAVSEWARHNNISPSKLLIPLSYATILGGTMTVIGTSTNLVVTGLIEKNLATTPGLVPVGIFDITPIGAAVAFVGCTILVITAPWTLPDRKPAVSKSDDPREYTVEFLVAPGSALVGRSIEEAGLRNLPNSYLVEIDRENTILPAVEPTTILRASDRLVFVGARESVVDLTRIPGLLPAPTQAFKLQSPSSERCLVEAVVAPANPLVGKSIKDGEFRTQFNAVVIAVARDGKRLEGKIGDIVLELGDVLLLEAHSSWTGQQRSRRDFYLVSEVEDSSSFQHDKAWIALVILIGMVGSAATEFASMFQASMVAAFLMVATGCASPLDARRSMDWGTLVAIAASFGIGEGIRVSGADQLIASGIVAAGADGPMSALIAMYVATAVLTELITNNAAAALMFPFGISLATSLGVSPMPFSIAVMFAASASFITPIGYQTNLMVYGPGGYQFGDYVRSGWFLQVASGVVTLTLTPLLFPF